MTMGCILCIFRYCRCSIVCNMFELYQRFSTCLGTPLSKGHYAYQNDGVELSIADHLRGMNHKVLTGSFPVNIRTLLQIRD